MTIQIYELGDIARILGIEKSLVTNWTIGRPFSVKASIRASIGKGSRNLFGRNDVYCFALVQRLNEVGAPVAGIQKMLEKIGPRMTDDAFWKDQDWIVINRKGRDFSYDIEFDAESTANVTLQPEDEVVCFYAIYLRSVTDAVSTKIAMLSGQARQSGEEAGKRNRATGGKAEKGSDRARKAKGPVQTVNRR